MRVHNAVLICIFCAGVAAAIGFAAGALLTYPNRQRVNAEIEATIAAAKKDLVTGNNLLRTEIQQLLDRLKKATDTTKELNAKKKLNTEHLAATIKLNGCYSTLCDLKNTQLASLETGSIYTAKETITYTTRELEKLLAKVRNMSLPDSLWSEMCREGLLQAVNAVYTLQHLIASHLENPALSTGIDGVKRQSEEVKKSIESGILILAEMLYAIDPGLVKAMYPAEYEAGLREAWKRERASQKQTK